MDWRTRIAAIVLAGGSVAGCASAADPGVDAGTAEPSPQSSGSVSVSGNSAEPLVDPAATIPLVKLPEVPARPRRRYQVPICNANPDPCCRAPNSPECAARPPPIEPSLRRPE